MPLLLVSVRNATEARLALEAGVDILDVKEPSLGSLGAAPNEVLAEIGEIAANCPGRLFTAAMGELTDLIDSSRLPAIPATFGLLKVGLSGCRSLSDWPMQWAHVRESIESRAGKRFDWAGVAYVDEREAGSPPVHDVLETAIEAKCRFLLLDTWSKSAGRLSNFFSDRALAELGRQCRGAGLQLAVAGRLRVEDLTDSLLAAADVVAVRSAVCRNQQRAGAIDPEAIQKWRSVLRD
jgi:uncharacterized protein (UPF0264 family)